MISTENTVLVVIDVQGKLAEVVAEAEERLKKLLTLVEASKLLEIPCILTVQVPEKLGYSHPSLKALLPDAFEYPRKIFNILADSSVEAAIKATAKKQIILCGYEAHICLFQSSLALAKAGYEVYLVDDAISSRDLNNKRVAEQELVKDPHIHLVTVEMLLFALLKDALHPAFRQISKLVR